MPATHPTPIAGTLSNYLAAEDLGALSPIAPDEWQAMRMKELRRMLWSFCTLRNLWAYRGRFAHDAIGYSWAGIFRSLRVGSIVATSYRNEGHFRADDRIFGTSDFFSGALRFARSSSALSEIIRIVNLRHHVAGVVTREGETVAVAPGYEADYTYVATAFIESLRRGYDACGIAPNSPRGQQIAEALCTIFYQIAGMTGLQRAPKNRAAHDRFRDAFEQDLQNHPPSPRVQRMAQEIAHRIIPLTSAMSRVTVATQVARHLDQTTRALLFPEGSIPAELESQQQHWRHAFANMPALSAVESRVDSRKPRWQRDDVASLLDAYQTADSAFTSDRLIGAVLLYLLDAPSTSATPLERRTIQLEPGDALIRQGQDVQEMYILLSTSADLVVEQLPSDGSPLKRLATLRPPTVLGEIGMWRNRPAVATVTTHTANTVEVLVINREQFVRLKDEPGFRAAIAAEVQRRLAINAKSVTTLLDDTAKTSSDPLLTSLSQLLRYLSGDSHTSLDAIVDLPNDATLVECIEALRTQMHEAFQSRDLPPELASALRSVVDTIS